MRNSIILEALVDWNRFALIKDCVYNEWRSIESKKIELDTITVGLNKSAKGEDETVEKAVGNRGIETKV